MQTPERGFETVTSAPDHIRRLTLTGSSMSIFRGSGTSVIHSACSGTTRWRLSRAPVIRRWSSNVMGATGAGGNKGLRDRVKS